jgi:RimJ/RimL family protein N-acetyltransferase
LLVRPVEPTDAAAILEMNKHPEVVQYTSMDKTDKPWTTLAQADAWVQRTLSDYARCGYGRYVVAVRATGGQATRAASASDVIGWHGVKWRSEPHFQHVDMGYRLHPAYWGKGFATEAGQAVLLHAFYTLGMPTVHAGALTENEASVKVMRKLGGLLTTHDTSLDALAGEGKISSFVFHRPSALACLPVLFSSERMDFRRIRKEDAGLIWALCSDPEVVRYTGAGSFLGVSEAAAFIQERYLAEYASCGYSRWLLVLRGSDECAGWCGLRRLPDGRVEVGYRLFRRLWGQGLATEAVRACLRYGLEQLKLREIVALVYVAHVASKRVCQKAGMLLQGLEPAGAPEDPLGPTEIWLARGSVVS